MKKLSILCLVLCLLCGSCLAESAYTHYAHPHLGYELDIPADWITVDTETLDARMQEYNDISNMKKYMIYSSILTTAESVKANDVALFISPDVMANINVVVEDIGAKVTARQLMPLITDQVIELYKTTLGEFELLKKDEYLTFGDNEYGVISLRYEIAGKTLVLGQFYTVLDTKMVCVTFTADSASAEQNVDKYQTILENAMGSLKLSE